MTHNKNISVCRLSSRPMAESDVEFVERKGLGHPDFIADAIAEAVSVGLCKKYMEMFGRIMHHNVDKVLVVGGQSRPKFGGGEVLQPIYVLVAGRATTEVSTPAGVEVVPVGPIVLEAAKGWIRENFRHLDAERHIVVDYRIGRGSADLVDIFQRSKNSPGANDTSIGVGYFPLTETEKLVLETERMLNSASLKKELPAVGEDVKVMAVRQGDRIDLTVAAAIISSYVLDMGEYVSVKEEVRERILDLASRITSRDVHVHVNTGDDVRRGDVSGIYLVVTGTSAEGGDDGATGRGNRANGLITPLRPMSMEATAGKNPVNHVGKLYNVLANIIARKVASIDGIDEAYVKLLSQIGRPIDDPLIAHVGVVCGGCSSFNSIKYEVEHIVEEELGEVGKLWSPIIEGKVQLF